MWNEGLGGNRLCLCSHASSFTACVSPTLLLNAFMAMMPSTPPNSGVTSQNKISSKSSYQPRRHLIWDLMGAILTAEYCIFHTQDSNMLTSECFSKPASSHPTSRGPHVTSESFEASKPATVSGRIVARPCRPGSVGCNRSTVALAILSWPKRTKESFG